MIARLRRRHLRTFLLLTALLLTLLVLAVRARPEGPRERDLPRGTVRTADDSRSPR